MKNDLFATLIFDFPRQDFKGCNAVILETTEKLDGQLIEVREASYKFEPKRVRLSCEVYAKNEDLREKPIYDEGDLDKYFQDKVFDAGLGDCTVLEDMINSELSERPQSEVDEANEELRAEYRRG